MMSVAVVSGVSWAKVSQSVLIWLAIRLCAVALKIELGGRGERGRKDGK